MRYVISKDPKSAAMKMAKERNEFMTKKETYPQRKRVERMPFDHWDSERGYSHATGWEVRLSPSPADWWIEFEDEKTGETFLAR